jgi:hypothetical protein
MPVAAAFQLVATCTVAILPLASTSVIGIAAALEVLPSVDYTADSYILEEVT